MPAARVQRLEDRRLARAVRLAGPERDRAAVGDQQRVEHVDEVRVVVGLRVEDVDDDAEALERLDEAVVLAPGAVEVDRPQEAARRVVERCDRTPGRAP